MKSDLKAYRSIHDNISWIDINTPPGAHPEMADLPFICVPRKNKAQVRSEACECSIEIASIRFRFVPLLDSIPIPI
jgi:hypothetical protein